MKIDQVFASRKNDPKWNTSYPLSPEDWVIYRVLDSLSFQEDKELSFYIHIPFCKQLCSFCEYTKMICPNDKLQMHYIETIGKDIEKFKERYPNIILKGFDIGGGTPTSLSNQNFNLLLDVYDKAISGICLADGYEPSIEGTFTTLSDSKLRRIVQSGILRLSLGIQSTDTEVLCSNHRERISEDIISEWLDKAYKAGVQKINFDLMYGLKGQTELTIAQDLDTIKRLLPEQVTLYELRTNMLNSKDIPSKEALYSYYKQYYDGLTNIGYYGNFGQNTFSLIKSDFGVSSYLKSRMIEGGSYKGFGISAQSMSKKGVSYNCGKNNKDLMKIIRKDSYQEEHIYHLPPEELYSKYIAISGYCGSFKLDDELSDKEYIKKALQFCIDNNLLKLSDNNILRITEEGFLYYGAVLSLFYCPPNKKYCL